MCVCRLLLLSYCFLRDRLSSSGSSPPLHASLYIYVSLLALAHAMPSAKGKSRRGCGHHPLVHRGLVEREYGNSWQRAACGGKGQHDHHYSYTPTCMHPSHPPPPPTLSHSSKKAWPSGAQQQRGCERELEQAHCLPPPGFPHVQHTPFFLAPTGRVCVYECVWSPPAPNPGFSPQCPLSREWSN